MKPSILRAIFDQLRRGPEIEYLGHGKGRCLDCKARFGTTVERTCTCHSENDNAEGDERHRAALARHDELVRCFAPDDDPRYFE